MDEGSPAPGAVRDWDTLDALLGQLSKVGGAGPELIAVARAAHKAEAALHRLALPAAPAKLAAIAGLPLPPL